MLKGTEPCREWYDLAKIRTRPRFYACPCYLQVWKKSDKKTTEKRWRHCFPYFKSMGAFCCHGNQSLSRLANWAKRNSSFIWIMTEWHNHRMTQPQNAGMTRQIQYNPHFFKVGLQIHVCQKIVDWMVNSIDPDQSDLGLHCLLRPICLKT